MGAGIEIDWIIRNKDQKKDFVEQKSTKDKVFVFFSETEKKNRRQHAVIIRQKFCTGESYKEIIQDPRYRLWAKDLVSDSQVFY